MLKQKSVLPVETDMDTGTGMRPDITLCSLFEKGCFYCIK